MRSLVALCAMVFSPSLNARATETLQEYLYSAPAGTYQTLTTSSVAECSAHCQQDSDTCKGQMSIQNDITIESYTCYLNDGLNPDSPFFTPAPDSIDLQRAVSDYNQYRLSQNLPPIKLNQKLISASQMHSDDMAKNGMVSHSGSDGTASGDRAQMKGYYFSILAENVAGGQKNWDEAFKAWQESPGHNANLLRDDITEFGVALSFNRNSQFNFYWAMLVGSPLDPNEPVN